MLGSQVMADSLADFKVSQGEAHVWCAPLKQSDQFVEQCYRLLSTDEKDRAARYYFDHLRKSFIVARGLLRLLLAQYVNVQPEQLEYLYLKAGKLRLSDLPPFFAPLRELLVS